MGYLGGVLPASLSLFLCHSPSLPAYPKIMPPTSLFTSDIACPAVGFGTFQSDDGNGNIKQGVLQALRFGYRHIDTTIAYGNEREVG